MVSLNPLWSIHATCLHRGAHHNHDELCIVPARLVRAIDTALDRIFKRSPLVLIDVKSGRLCDAPQRMNTFKSELQYQELVSSAKPDEESIQRVVDEYFKYVMFSHVWEGREPSYQDVQLVGSIQHLDESPLNNKLRSFCKLVSDDGYRWAWSDTCCIDKTISTVLTRSLKMMYKWYQASAATFVYLLDVDSELALGSLIDSTWMTRAWASQELLVPAVIRFYDRNWKPYIGDTHCNHKESPEIMQELTNAIGISRETITSFNPECLTVREKLQLASTRNATLEEDIAYSLIGIFKSDIRTEYGEGDAALGHLLEEIVDRSGEVVVLAWVGTSSSYNSCLPASLSVYKDARPSSIIQEAEMNARVATLRSSLSQTDADHAMSIYAQITSLPPARFANRRLRLPSIIFRVKQLRVKRSGTARGGHYRSRVSGIGHVEFHSLTKLSIHEPRKYILVHPWIRDLCDPYDQPSWGIDESESEYSSEPWSATGSGPNSPLHPRPPNAMDVYTRALRLVVRLRGSFRALLLEKQPTGEFKRVAAEHDIVIPGLHPKIRFSKNISARVVEIL